MTGTLSVGGVHTDTTKELYERRHRVHRHPGGRRRHDAVEHSDVTGNTEMTGTLSVGGTHDDTDKELYERRCQGDCHFECWN